MTPRATLSPGLGRAYRARCIVWGMVTDGDRSDQFDIIDALVCLAGMAVKFVGGALIT